jgi:DNA-binding CsgD family transcriptional regulator
VFAVTLDPGTHSRFQSLSEQGATKSRPASGRAFLEVSIPTQTVAGSIGSIENLAHATVRGLIDASFEALDLLNIGLILCGESGQLQFTNRTADEILQSRDGLEVNAQGVLQATQEDAFLLSELIDRVLYADADGIPGRADVAISLRRASRKRPLTVLVRRADGVVPGGGNTTKPGALLIVIDSALPVHTQESELRRLYGLTSTESRLAKLLMEGKDLDGCCDELGISRSTVRMHRRNLFSKTEVRRQTQLIALLFKSIGLGPRGK